MLEEHGGCPTIEHVLVVNEQRLKVISAPPLFEVPGQVAVEFDPEDVVLLGE